MAARAMTVRGEEIAQRRPRESMPNLARITHAWEALGEERLRESFPELRCFSIGWGEPFCFRCGWLAPTGEAADYPSDWPAARTIDAAWQASRGWLERCHLQDHCYGGSVDPLNWFPCASSVMRNSFLAPPGLPASRSSTQPLPVTDSCRGCR